MKAEVSPAPGIPQKEPWAVRGKQSEKVCISRKGESNPVETHGASQQPPPTWCNERGWKIKEMSHSFHQS